MRKIVRHADDDLALRLRSFDAPSGNAESSYPLSRSGGKTRQGKLFGIDEVNLMRPAACASFSLCAICLKAAWYPFRTTLVLSQDHGDGLRTERRMA
jgi:hypothetical protein